MDEPDQLASAVAMLIRYETAKAALYRAANDFRIPLAADLTDRIARADGHAVVEGGIHVMTWMSPPVVADDDNPEFFRAVVWGEDNIVDIEPERLHALRRYVLNDDHGLFLRVFGSSLFLHAMGMAK
jgi:hypothetical protein